jgi:hypothetical protein
VSDFFDESGLFVESGEPINPMTPALSLLVYKIHQRKYNGFIGKVDSVIAVIVYALIIGLFLPLWCFCIIAYIEELLRDLIIDYFRVTKYEAKSGLEKFATMMATGFMGLLWIPTLLSCAPIALIGWLTSYFTKTKERIIYLLIILVICFIISMLLIIFT